MAFFRFIASSFFFFLLLSGLSPLVNSQTTDSCSSNLNLGNQISFNTTSLSCYPVWAFQNYILRYAETRPNLWSFVLSAPNTGAYVAIGFSPDGYMIGSSAVVGWVTPEGVGGIQKYLLGDKKPDEVKPGQGKLPLVENSMGVASTSSRVYVAFQLNTTMPGSRLIYAVGNLGQLPTPPGDQLTVHNYSVSTTLNYLSGQSQTQKVVPYAKLKKSHGALNMVGWGILMLIGAMVARYCKQWDPIWFYSHISIQSLGFILGVFGVISGFVLEHKLGAMVTKHKGIGIFILVLGCLQVLAILARPKKDSKYRIYWNWYHHNVGRLLILFAAVNVFYGIHLGKAGRGWDAGYAIVLVGLSITAILLEIRMWMKK